MEIKLGNKKKILKHVDTVNIVGGKNRRENQKKLIHPDTKAFVNLNSLTNSMTLQICVFFLPSKCSVFSSPWTFSFHKNQMKKAKANSQRNLTPQLNQEGKNYNNYIENTKEINSRLFIIQPLKQGGHNFEF